jgi:hypothetical protein
MDINALFRHVDAERMVAEVKLDMARRADDADAMRKVIGELDAKWPETANPETPAG